MKRCGSCVVCSYVQEGNKVKAEIFTWTINKKVSSQISNVIFLIQYDKERYKKRYIGFTTEVFKERMSQHHVRNKTMSKATGGHDKNNIKFTILEKVRSADPLYGREREQFHIRKFNTF